MPAANKKTANKTTTEQAPAKKASAKKAPAKKAPAKKAPADKAPVKKAPAKAAPAKKAPAKKTTAKTSAVEKAPATAPAKKAPAKRRAPAKPIEAAKTQIKVSGDVLVASTAEKNILFDYYGNLLGDRQKDIYSLYYEDNLSLSEIALEIGISRQAVHEALKKAEQLLSEAEEKLALIEKHEAYAGVLLGIEQAAAKLVSDISESDIEKATADRIKRQLRKIIKQAKELDI